MVSEDQQSGSWDIVRELMWVGHPLMVAAADEIERLRNYTKTGVVETSAEVGDIVTRLRSQCYCGPINPEDGVCDVCEAADQIESLRAFTVTLQTEIATLEAHNVGT